MPALIATDPLLALDAVVFDTETTGLDPAQARLLQIGAVRLVAGHPDEANTFEIKVNPGTPIRPPPPRFTACAMAMWRMRPPSQRPTLPSRPMRAMRF